MSWLEAVWLNILKHVALGCAPDGGIIATVSRAEGFAHDMPANEQRIGQQSYCSTSTALAGRTSQISHSRDHTLQTSLNLQHAAGLGPGLACWSTNWGSPIVSMLPVNTQTTMCAHESVCCALLPWLQAE